MAKHPNATDIEAEFLRQIGRSGLQRLLDWVARFSLWVDPAVYKSVATVYPKTRRKRSGETRRDWVGGAKLWTNEPAQEAFFRAIGSKRVMFKQYNLCHLYDGSVYHPEHFTNLANMTVVPKSLASFTECAPIQDVLKWHSFRLYGYRGPLAVAPRKPSYYPSAWRGVQSLGRDRIHAVLENLKNQVLKKPHYAGS